MAHDNCISHRMVSHEVSSVADAHDGKFTAKVCIHTVENGEDFFDYVVSPTRFATSNEAFEEACKIKWRLDISEVHP
jgi:hypothetical protein